MLLLLLLLIHVVAAAADSCCCWLVQVHWLRVILDEGHMLGASLAMTNKLQMACSLRAERCSATPAPTPPLPSHPAMLTCACTTLHMHSVVLVKLECVTQFC